MRMNSYFWKGVKLIFVKLDLSLSEEGVDLEREYEATGLLGFNLARDGLID